MSTAPRSDKVFDGSIPEFYETYLTPLIFEPYARDLGQRVKLEPVSRVLEVASGTGVVTRAMVDTLGANVSIVATDLNQPMLDYVPRSALMRMSLGNRPMRRQRHQEGVGRDRMRKGVIEYFQSIRNVAN